MLVLSRKRNEVIVIYNTNDNSMIEVTITSIEEGKIRLGFDAPQHITIDRKEVYESKKTGRT